MIEREYIYYQDPGHGWLKVPKVELQSLGLSPSHYSYERGQHVYLEEDCDMPAFIRAKALAGVQVRVVESHTNSQSEIRSYNRAA